MGEGQITYEKVKDGIAIIRIQGAFTKETTPNHQKVCEAIANDKEIKGIILDFQNVTEADTSAFACMIGLIRMHLGENIQIAIANAGEEERRLLEILKIPDVIHVFRTLKEAIRALRKGPLTKRSDTL